MKIQFFLIKMIFYNLFSYSVPPTRICFTTKAGHLRINRSCLHLHQLQVLNDCTYLVQPVLYENTVALFFLLLEIYLAAFRLHYCVITFFLFAMYTESGPRGFSDFAIGSQRYGAFVVVIFGKVLQFTVFIQFKDSKLFVAVPVFLYQAALEYAIISILEHILTVVVVTAVSAVKLAERKRKFALFLREAGQFVHNCIHFSSKTDKITLRYS